MYSHNSSPINFSAWITRPNPSANPQMRLFCFPFGGGGASYYHKWRSRFSTDVELCGIQLPGRENRLREAPFTDLMKLVHVLTNEIAPYLDRPYAFFGHSMGSLIAFELARNLVATGQLGPRHLIVSGRRAPHLPSTEPPLRNLPDPQFIQAIRQYNGTPDIIFHDPDLLQIFLPVLRADLTLLETYNFAPDQPIRCPLTALGGAQDPTVRRDDLAAWAPHTAGTFELKLFPGDHFYLKTQTDALIAQLHHTLSTAISQPFD
jgi:medium-chain acyl-[acyl-carrier-protein] hydrolase